MISGEEWIAIKDAPWGLVTRITSVYDSRQLAAEHEDALIGKTFAVSRPAT